MLHLITFTNTIFLFVNGMKPHISDGLTKLPEAKPVNAQLLIAIKY